jgi:quercetin dioxygenase-like cupin family protein
MSVEKIAQSDARVTATPNAVMTTLASPTQGGTKALSLWRVAMTAGQRGPNHSFDVEQAWHLLEGSAELSVDGKAVEVSVGDTVIVPAGVPRQIGTGSGAAFVVCGVADGSATPISADGPGEAVAPAWIV